MKKAPAFEAFVCRVLPDPADRDKLQRFFGSFLARVTEPPGCLVVAGNGCGAWLLNGLVFHMLGGNVSEVPACDLAMNPDKAVMAAGVQVNFVHDMTCAAAWSCYGRALRRCVVDGVLFDGDDSPAPRMVIQSRYTPTAADLAEVSGCAVVLELGVMEKLGVQWADLLCEMHGIRAWAREGLSMLEKDGFGRAA